MNTGPNQAPYASRACSACLGNRHTRADRCEATKWPEMGHIAARGSDTHFRFQPPQLPKPSETSQASANAAIPGFCCTNFQNEPSPHRQCTKARIVTARDCPQTTIGPREHHHSKCCDSANCAGKTKILAVATASNCCCFDSKH